MVNWLGENQLTIPLNSHRSQAFHAFSKTTGRAFGLIHDPCNIFALGQSSAVANMLPDFFLIAVCQIDEIYDNIV